MPLYEFRCLSTKCGASFYLEGPRRRARGISLRPPLRHQPRRLWERPQEDKGRRTPCRTAAPAPDLVTRRRRKLRRW